MTTTISYCDYNASAPVRPEAAAAVAAALAAGGNPSSVHARGRTARAAVEAARAEVAALAGAAPEEVVFTSGGTEANALALGGVRAAAVITSAIEHDSVLAAAPDALRVPVDGDGVVDLGALDALLARAPAPALVSVMMANNETGVVQPVAEVVSIARRHGALVHCDAVQAAGRLAIDVAGLGLDLASLSAHKIGGPAGVGALVVRDGVALAPLFAGGGQERRRRAGTENLAGIAGFGVAARLALEDLATTARRAGLRDRFEAEVAALAPEAPVYGRGAPRLANTSCIGMPGVAAETQVMALDLDGVAVSAGAACSSGKVTRSHVLGAMGVAPAPAGEAIRVSLGWHSGEDDVRRLTEAWRRLYLRTRARVRGEMPAAVTAA